MGRTDPQDDLRRPDSIERVQTRDGSVTLYDAERDVHYSSLHGARDEARHIFLEGTGLADRERDWCVLELGFGAGINFVQTARRFERENPAGDLVYHSVDYAPVHPNDVDFHDGPWGASVREALDRATESTSPRVERRSGDSRIALVLHTLDWCDLELPEFRADAIFFDPFGPKSEPASWRPECFRVARRHLHSDGVLGTYSAATRVKRAMFEAELNVASAPGPGPKREITFAALSEEALESHEPLDRSRYLGVDD